MSLAEIMVICGGGLSGQLAREKRPSISDLDAGPSLEMTLEMTSEVSTVTVATAATCPETNSKSVHPDVRQSGLEIFTDDASGHQRLDALEAAMLDGDNPFLEPIQMPVVHRFTPGLYSREISMPGPRPGRSGAILTSRVHSTTHQYVVLSGVAEVAIPGQEPVILRAGHTGITEAGTRRGLRILEDCRWITFHPLSQGEEEARAAGASEVELLAAVEERIIGKHERADGRDTHQEYRERLAARGLPGPHDGARALTEGA